MPAQIVGEQEPWAGEWYVHRETLPLLESIRAGRWEPRTVFLSPFDNLICDRERTEQFFDFHYRIEIYVPKAKRQYGYYVLPLLHGDRFIGRMDSRFDRKEGIYRIHALHSEQDAPIDARSGSAVAESLLELAQFIGASRVELGERIPAPWREGSGGANPPLMTASAQTAPPQSTSASARFGTFGGVFTPNVLTILGLILFLRTGWVVGQAGLLGALLIVAIANCHQLPDRPVPVRHRHINECARRRQVLPDFPHAWP